MGMIHTAPAGGYRPLDTDAVSPFSAVSTSRHTSDRRVSPRPAGTIAARTHGQCALVPAEKKQRSSMVDV
jgi:hypothetical protein